MLQYYLGGAGYANITGGAAARSVAECGFTANTRKDLWLRAYSTGGYSQRHASAHINSLIGGELKNKINGMFSL